MTHQARTPPRFRRIEAPELRRALETNAPPLLLDVRRQDAFSELPGIVGAVPFPLDRDPPRLPDVPRDRAIVVYCL